MTNIDRIREVGLACGAAILLGLAAASSAAAQPLLSPSESSLVCPAIEEDGLLCSADLMSGNCADFVAAAERLGGLYRGELAQAPGSQGSLLATTWWGCGPGKLGDVTALLIRIGSPSARALLKLQPYATLASQQPAPPQSGPPATAADCNNLSDGLARNACVDTQLQAARAENQSVLARCQQIVPAGLRDDFVASQTSFQALLPTRCNAQAAGYDDDPSMSSFVRSRCLVAALTDNTQGMLAAHPECQAAD